VRGGNPVYWSLRQEKIWSKNRDILDTQESSFEFTSVAFVVHAKTI
jgi:hypothetical protein